MLDQTADTLLMASPKPPTGLVARPSSSATAPTIVTASLPAATLGSSYTGTVTATGGLRPYTWKINAGSLPPGLALQAFNSSSVNISGTPTATGLYTFALLCTDAVGQSTQLALTMEHPQ